MSFFKRIVSSLRGGSSGSSGSGDKGFFVYVRISRSGEVVRLRLRPGYDISQDDSGRPFTRKLIIGQRSFDRCEAVIYFDKNYQVADSEFEGGELVSESEWNTQQSQQESQNTNF